MTTEVEVLKHKIKMLEDDNFMLKTKLMNALKDVNRITWLGDNFYYNTLDSFDVKLHPGSWSWRFFAPKEIQGDIRKVLDAAIEREQDEYV